MRLDGAKKWYAGAALASVLVLVAGWLLLLSPQRATADDLAAQADSQVVANQASQAKIDALKAQYTNLPSLQKELALVTTHLPQAANMPSLIRTLSQAAARSGVTLKALTPTNPTPLTTSATGVQSGSLSAPGQVNAIGVTLQISGPFANTRLFLSSLEAMPRAFLVTGLAITRDQNTGTVTSKAAPGSLSSTITGRVFMANPGLPAAAVATTTSTTTTNAAAPAANG
ncbi:MAG: type 4a pilus biogenesis protein PilO [Actinomycetales bacterium]|nr:type 4a pilus biogenesis protein PilO [Actinomycetales bacterium]